MTSVYQTPPAYETAHFSLRLVCQDDAADLLACYSDPAAVAVMNADSCTSDFHYTTLAEMQDCISFWLREYAAGLYVRLAIVDRASGRAVGTVEIFGGEYGVLRIDLCTAYETRAILSELMALAVARFYADLGIDTMAVKAVPAAGERIAALEGQGFAATDAFRPGLHYYVRPRG
jgi:ribosomal-protein-alanine N-acetyltransferase